MIIQPNRNKGKKPKVVVRRRKTNSSMYEHALNGMVRVAKNVWVVEDQVEDYYNSMGDPPPKPTDGPDYHAEWRAWRERNKRV